MLPFVRYMLARLVLFVVAVTVLGALGAQRELALIGGLLISVLLAYLLLPGMRDAATAAVVDRVQARNERRATRVDEDALVEDAQVDDVHVHDDDVHVREAHVREAHVREAHVDEAEPQPDRRG